MKTIKSLEKELTELYQNHSALKQNYERVKVTADIREQHINEVEAFCKKQKLDYTNLLIDKQESEDKYRQRLLDEYHKSLETIHKLVCK